MPVPWRFPHLRPRPRKRRPPCHGGARTPPRRLGRDTVAGYPIWLNTVVCNRINSNLINILSAPRDPKLTPRRPGWRSPHHRHEPPTSSSRREGRISPPRPVLRSLKIGADWCRWDLRRLVYVGFTNLGFELPELNVLWGTSCETKHDLPISASIKRFLVDRIWWAAS